MLISSFPVNVYSSPFVFQSSLVASANGQAASSCSFLVVETVMSEVQIALLGCADAW